MSQRKLDTAGFTILELLIATTVFSTILLITSYALLQVGRVYYKGITSTRTQEVARTIMDDVAQAIQFSGEQVVPNTLPNGSINGICVDSRLYSYQPGVKLDNAPNKHVLVAEKIGGCNSGIQALSIGTPGVISPEAREFLPGDMRIAELKVALVNPSLQLYSVRVRVVAGDNELLFDPGLSTARCRGDPSGSHFCAVSDISTIVQKRIN